MIKKILTEWSFRLDDGIINLNNPKHLLILSEVLKDMDLPTKVIMEVMSNLTEKDLVRKKQDDGSYGSAYLVKKHNPDKGQELIKKNASEEDKEKVQKKKTQSKKQTPTTQKKPDYDIDTNASEEEIAKKTGGGKFVKTNEQEAKKQNDENSKQILSRKRKGKGGKDTTQREELASISRMIANKYPEDNTPEKHKKRVIEHIRELYGDDTKEAERVIRQINKPKKADNIIDPTLSGLNTMKVLRNKDNGFDMADKQPEPYPLNVTFTPEATQTTQNLLITKLKECKKLKNPSEREECQKHYKKELDAFQKKATSATGVEGDGDTAMVYMDNNGRTRVVYISNKKSLTDGHSNATVTSASEVLKQSAAEGANVDVISESIDEATKEAKDVNKTYSENARKIIDENKDKLNKPLITKIALKALTGRAFFTSNSTTYLESAAKNKRVKKCLEEKGIEGEVNDDFLTKNAEQIVDCSLKFIGTGETTGMGDSAKQGPNKLLLKLARTTRKVREMIQSRLDKGESLEEACKFASEKGIGGSQSLTPEDCKAIYEDDTLKQFEENNTKRDRAMDKAHSGVQQRLESLDINYYMDEEGLSEEEALEKQKNEAGPHEKTVIRGFFKRMHWDKYMDGSDDDIKILEIGNLAITPKQIRGCLGELSKWDGNGTLSEHLEKNVRIEPGTQRLVFTTDNGDVEIGNDTWRMAGDLSKISGSLGEGLRDCLEEKAS